jgi:Skp family chaperone for outer membrane proteins
LEQVDIELSEKSAIIQLEQDLVNHMKKVYKEVRREVEAVARERNLKAVFMVADAKISGRTREQVSSEILVRSVLWFDPSLDLTAELLRRLNK